MSCFCFETVLKDFVFKLVVTQNIFPLSSKALWSGINSCYRILFQIWSTKEHKIIIIRTIRYHIRPMYIETPDIYKFFFFI